MLQACIRCTVPNVDPDAGKRDRLQEPSATMEGFRRLGSNLYFGQNLVQYSKSGEAEEQRGGKKALAPLLDRGMSCSAQWNTRRRAHSAN